MKKLVLLTAVLALAAGLTLQTPVVHAQSGQAQVTFLNNTATPLSFGVDDTSGYICRVFVQYGSCSTYVTPGSHTLFAKTDDGKVALTEALYAEAGETYTWTIVPQ
jgi:hypothetical protein